MCKKGRRNILQFTYDIEECIDIIQEETSEISFEEFINDRKTIGYIERQLEKIGEKIGEAISQIQKLDKNILDLDYYRKLVEKNKFTNKKVVSWELFDQST